MHWLINNIGFKHSAFDRRVSLICSNLKHFLVFFFVFCDADIFEEHKLFVLFYVRMLLDFGFIWSFLVIEQVVCYSWVEQTQLKQYPSQGTIAIVSCCLSARYQGIWLKYCPIFSLYIYHFLMWLISNLWRGTLRRYTYPAHQYFLPRDSNH